MTKHSEGMRGTRGNVLKAVEELESKHLKITNGTIRTTQEAIASTCLMPEHDPDNCTNEMGEPIADSHFTDVVLQGSTEE